MRYSLLTAFCLFALGVTSVPGRAQNAAPAKPTLTLLTVGVSQYKDPTNDLQYPARDAASVARVLTAQEGKLFGKVIATQLTDQAVTRVGLIESLAALRRQARQNGPEDYTIVFLSGHGVTDDLGQYFFAPYDVDADQIDATGVSGMTITQTLVQMPGHILLLLLDTAHAGAVNGGHLPIAVFAACGKRELTQESKDWQGGAFSVALCEGLGGKADTDSSGTVTLSELADYVVYRVATMTRDNEHPVLSKSDSVLPTLPLAVTK